MTQNSDHGLVFPEMSRQRQNVSALLAKAAEDLEADHERLQS